MFDKAMAAMAKREARKYMDRETVKASHHNPIVGKVMVSLFYPDRKNRTRFN